MKNMSSTKVIRPTVITSRLSTTLTAVFEPKDWPITLATRNLLIHTF